MRKSTSDTDFNLLFLGADHRHDVGTQQHQNACNGLIPGEDILPQPDGDKRGDHRLEIGVDTHRRGLQILHGKGDKEVAEGCGANDDEGHLEYTVPTPR